MSGRDSTSPSVLALDIGGTKLAAAVGDAGGRLRRRSSVPTHGSDGAERVLQRAIELAQSVLAAERAAGGDVGALGVSTMGLTRDDRVELAPNVPGWERLAVPGALDAAFGDLPLALGNDVKVATLAELRWGALSGVDCGVYLNLGTGIAAGLVAGGDIVAGAHGAAGEIGYWLLRGRGEPLVVDAGAAPTEEAFGGRGVAGRAAAALHRPVDVVELLELAGRDAHAAELLDDVWDGIAALAANLAIVWDPEVLVLGGGYMRAAGALIDRITTTVQQAVPLPPIVTRAHFEADASLHGAVALAYRRLVAGRAGAPAAQHLISSVHSHQGGG